jgi:hypothetical protein
MQLYNPQFRLIFKQSYDIVKKNYICLLKPYTMKLKLTSTLLALIMGCLINFADAQTYDKRLEPYYSKEEIQQMIRDDIKQYIFLVNALNKGIFIADIPEEKASSIVYDGEIEIDPDAEHTFLSLGLSFTESYQYYKIAGSNKMLVVLPRVFLEPKK